MALWTYSAWASQATDSLRLDMLRLHIAEVSAKVGSDVSADGKSVSNLGLITYLDQLQGRMTELEERVQRATSGRMFSRARFA